MSRFAWRTLANFSHWMSTMHRMALCLALALSLGGCIDYKWGHDWKADSLGGWQDASKGRYEQGTSFKLACGPEPLYVKVTSAPSHHLMSLLFIPLVPAATGDDNHLSINARYPSLSACSSAAQNPLVIKLDNRVISNIGYVAGNQAGSCELRLDERELQGERVSIEVNQAVLPCAVAPLTLKKNSFFCLRQTQYGGSKPCNR